MSICGDFGEVRLRKIVTGLLLIAAAGTLLLAARTAWYLLISVTNVPYPDQWVLLQEIQLHRAGETGWSYLWSPYWGQRPLLPRLLILFSVRYLHYAILPFVVTSVAAQVAMLLMVIRPIRRLLPDNRGFLWVATIAAVHLLLSSLQMEVFVEGIGIQYTIGYASAIAAIALLSGPDKSQSGARFGGVVLLAIASSVCLAIGILVWWILLIEAWLTRARRGQMVVLAAFGVLLSLGYALGYRRPDMGMGVAGAILHPVDALRIVALVLGGPTSLYSRSAGMAAGALGMAIAAALSARFCRRSSPRAAIALVFMVAFLMVSALSIAVGRISPEWLAATPGQPLPSRYLAPTLTFWAALFPLALACWKEGGLGRLGTLSAALMILILTAGTWTWQWRMSREWAIYSESYDAIASGFLAGVSDPQYMSQIVADEGLRDRLIDYMRQQNLSVFAEPRARWMEHNVNDIAPLDDGTACSATVQTAEVSASDPPPLRVTGTLLEDARSHRHLDILMVDDTGTVRGMARTLPIAGEQERSTKYFGYARGVLPRNLRLFLVVGGRVSGCRLVPTQ